MLEVLSKAIKAMSETAPSLVTTITGGFHHTLAPEKTPKPYCTFAIIGTVPSATMQGSLQIEEVLIQFSIFDDSTAPDNCLSYGDLIAGRFDWADLTMDAPWTSLLCQPNNRLFTRTPTQSWQYVIDYWMKMQK